MDGIQPRTITNQNPGVAHIKTSDPRCHSKNIAGLKTGKRIVERRKRQVMLINPPSLLERIDAMKQSRRLQGGVSIAMARHEIERQIAHGLPRPDWRRLKNSLKLGRANPVLEIMLTCAITDLAVSIAKAPGPFSETIKRISRHDGEKLFDKQHAIELGQVETQPFSTGLIERHSQIRAAKKKLSETGHRLIHRQSSDQESSLFKF